ncbi:MAG: hypothetical protein CVU71_05830 [Deltaproteobacteria bacterium HGW-Deltaproteobacteria-6]|jgi:hypothetical protein|nr:MAG: hypothetical protein CVU71_05830 [Deltaproteobacteria bacterium HGW-Deltaproteobacteria-6]
MKLKYYKYSDVIFASRNYQPIQLAETTQDVSALYTADLIRSTGTSHKKAASYASGFSHRRNDEFLLIFHHDGCKHAADIPEQRPI